MILLWFNLSLQDFDLGYVLFSDRSVVLCREGTQQSMLWAKPKKEIKHEVTEEKAAKQEVKVRTANIKREIKHESQEEAVFDEYEERNIRLLEIAAHMAHLEMEKSSLLREQGEVDTQHQVGAQEAQEAPPEEDAAQEEHEGAGCSSEEEAQEG